jgi:hypothetical protein
MSKRIKPTKGVPAKEFLESFCERDGKMLPEGEGSGQNNDPRFKVRSDVEDVIEIVSRQINPDVCLTEDQANLLNDQLVEEPCPIMTRFDELEDRWVEQQKTQSRLVTLINSYRLDCENCLNADCELRDPRTRLEYVMRRTEPELKLVEHMDLPQITKNALQKAGIQTLGDLCKYSERELLNIPHFGIKALKKVKRLLAEYSFRLKEDMSNVSKESLMRMSVDSLVLGVRIDGYEKIGVRVANCFQNFSINTVADLCERTPQDLLELTNFGNRCLEFVEIALAKYDLKLKGVS